MRFYYVDMTIETFKLTVFSSHEPLSVDPSICLLTRIFMFFRFKNHWCIMLFLHKVRVVPYISKNVAQVSGLIYGPIVFILYAIFQFKNYSFKVRYSIVLLQNCVFSGFFFLCICWWY